MAKLNKQTAFQYNPNFGSPRKPKPLIEEISRRNKVNVAKPKPLTPNLNEFMSRESNSDRVKIATDLINLNSNNDKVKSNQKQLSEKMSSTPETTTRASSSGTVTAPASTTTTKQQQTTTMPRRSTPKADSGEPRRENKSGKAAESGREDRRGKSTGGSASGINMKSTDFQKKGGDKGIFIPEPASKSIDYSILIPSTLHKNMDEATIINSSTTNGETLNKLEYSIASFSDRFYDMAQSTGNDATSAYYKALNDIFQKMSIDLFKDARSNLYSNWTLSNFFNYMYIVTKALEYMFIIDSELSYRPDLNTSIVNKGLLDRRNALLQSSLLVARADLRQALIGLWFPPELATLIRWFYQPYKSSDGLNSTCYRFIPGSDFLTNDPTSMVASITGYFTGTSNSLRTTVNMQIAAMLTKIYEAGLIADIPGAASDAKYDYHHYEIFINSPVIFTDPNASTNRSVYPCPSTATTDVPYYTMEQPSDKNGFPLLFQSLWTGNGTSLNYNAASAIVPGGIIKHMAASAAGAYNSGVCNKFYYDAVGVFQPKVYDTWHNFQHNDAHFPNIVGATTSYMSRLPRGFQRVYFNNVSAPALNIKTFVNNIFGLNT